MPDQLGRIAEALRAMPDVCPYHGHDTDPAAWPRPWPGDACCSTGRPSQLRKLAEKALDQLRECHGTPTRDPAG